MFFTQPSLRAQLGGQENVPYVPRKWCCPVRQSLSMSACFPAEYHEWILHSRSEPDMLCFSCAVSTRLPYEHRYACALFRYALALFHIFVRAQTTIHVSTATSVRVLNAYSTWRQKFWFERPTVRLNIFIVPRASR